MARTFHRLFQLIIICIVLLKYLVKTELFSSLVEIEELHETESVLIEILQKYIKKYGDQFSTLKTIMARYKEVHFPLYTSDTINTSFFRLTADIKEIEDLISYDVGEEFLENVANIRDILKFPTKEDLNGAAEAILRIQNTYGLETFRVARGDLNGRQYNVEMTSSDCFEIGRKSYLSSDYYHTETWMREAMNRLTESFTPKAIIAEYLMAVESFKKNLFSITNESSVSYNIFDDLLLESLCSNELPRPERELAQLHCRYVTNKSSFLKIGPLKLEEAHLDPYIVLYHEVIYKSEIEVIKTSVQHRLKRGSLLHKTIAEIRRTEPRTCKYAWLSDNEHQYIRKVALRVEDMTGLSIEMADPFQVINYGIGGHCMLHFDFIPQHKTMLNNKLVYKGDRFATVLFYMSDMPDGGATVFPKLNMAVWPKTGTALFWMNLYKPEKRNYLILHGGCPVITGSKWVVTKWLRVSGQNINWSCGLKSDYQCDF